MLFRRKDPSIDPKERAIWGDLMALGMVFPIAIALGFFLGRWAGKALGYPRAGTLIGLAWGVGAGFWELYKTTIRLNRFDDPGPGPGDGKDGDGTPGA
jgi:hypothetical protein